MNIYCTFNEIYGESRGGDFQMTKIVKMDTFRKKQEAKNKLEVQTDFKKLYGIDLDENLLSQKLRTEKRREKGLEWD